MANPTPEQHGLRVQLMEEKVMHRFMVPKIVGAVVLLSALGGGTAWAFTASNTVGPTYAGEGVGTVSGFVVSNVHYQLTQILNPTWGSNADISGVTFTLDHPAQSAGYALYDGGTAVGGGGCSSTDGGWSWTCTAYQNGYAPINQVTWLDVTAAQ